ncbi:MAG TPA: AMP-binding protein [Anaerolineales bacterium]|nr:AMP-binding protein [Anaerolineales bacterium]
MSTLGENLARTAAEAPDRVAIRLLEGEAASTITYAELVRGAGAYGQALARARVRRGDVVVIILEHGRDLLESFLGAILIGAVPSIMPFLTEKLSPERYQASLESLIQITQPAALVTNAAFEARARAAAEGRVRSILLDSQARGPLSEPLPSGPSAAPDDLCLLQHSSGTTGLQKGVALSHRAVLRQCRDYSRAIHLGDEDVIVSWLPLYHDMGLIAGFLLPLLSRVPLVLMSPFEWVRAPVRLLRAVSEYRGTLAWLPNFAYNFCAQKISQAELQGLDLSSWRAVINCSEPMRWRSHQLFLERFGPYGLRPEALATCYAMAENVFAVTQGGIGQPVVVDEIDLAALTSSGEARPARAGAGFRMLSAGRPIADTQVRILDSQHHPLPDRQLGEIALRSGCMLTGYYHRPDLTQEAFHDGWYLTGDLGYTVAGELYVTGRRKELIIVGGKNVYPQDIEELAGEVEGVHPGRVVAFGVFNEDLGTEEIAVVAESDSAMPVERRRIGDGIRTSVARGSDVVVRHVRVVEPRWLIKTSSGKLARQANRDKFLDEMAGPRKEASADTAAERESAREQS